MDQHDPNTSSGFSRRDFLKTSGALIVAFSLPLPFGCEQANAAEAQGRFPAKVPEDQLDSWLAVNQDGSVTACVGKVEVGMGISTAFMQIVAEELDVPVERVKLVMGDTLLTPDQRGTGGSNGIQQGGSALRKAGASARLALLERASARLNAPVEQLRVKDGVVYVVGDADRKVSYGELIGGQRFNLKLTDNAKPKNPQDYTIVGKPIPRMDIPPKVTAQYAYLVDLKLPGMLHGRVIRPPEAGAQLQGYDRAQRLPGLVKVVAKGNFLGVVCAREEQAIDAARALKAKWSKPAPLFSNSYDELYQTLRTGAIKSSKRDDKSMGDVDAALASAAKVIELDFAYPFQSHASMAPGCGVAHVHDGVAEIWTAGQKPYPLRMAIADLLHLPAEQVHVRWLPGPGSYGMNDADDAVADAALLSQAVGRPVRLQLMRREGTGWDPKAPAQVFHLRAGVDAQGNVIAWDYASRGYSGRLRPSGTQVAGDTLAGQLLGLEAKGEDLHAISSESYGFPNKRKIGNVLPWAQALGTGLRTSHMRDPDGMSTCFASESFIDHVAASLGADPVQFRLRYLTDERARAAVQAVAERAGWDTRPSPKKNQSGPKLTGRGIAYAPRNDSLVATVAEVEVNRDTGKVWVKKFTIAHDCGLVINPLQLQGAIEANLMQSMSRALHEEVQFDANNVKSVDWITYPIVDMTEVPERVDIVTLNNKPGAKSGGAGEPATRATAAAIANAIFDATGARMQRVPFTPERVKAALGKA